MGDERWEVGGEREKRRTREGAGARRRRGDGEGREDESVMGRVGGSTVAPGESS